MAITGVLYKDKVRPQLLGKFLVEVKKVRVFNSLAATDTMQTSVHFIRLFLQHYLKLFHDEIK